MSSWTERAKAVLPAGFGNFDASLVIERGQGSRVWMLMAIYLDYLIGLVPCLVTATPKCRRWRSSSRRVLVLRLGPKRYRACRGDL